jgi:hypothetical protein
VRVFASRGWACAATADDLQRPPKYRQTLVDPYRDHLRRRLAEEPGVAVTRLLAEIREQGYSGSANLLVRYLNQCRADAQRSTPSPRHLASWLMTKPEKLPADVHTHLQDLLARCPQLTALHGFVHGLRKDLPAVIAGLTLPYSDGPIEGANTKVKFLKRQMYGRAGFSLLRQ